MGRLIDADLLAERLQDFADWCKDERKQGVEFVLDCPLANSPTVEAIPKAEYENRLKADMTAMLEDLDIFIDEFDSGCGWDGYIKKIDVHEIIQQKITELKGEKHEV